MVKKWKVFFSIIWSIDFPWNSLYMRYFWLSNFNLQVYLKNFEHIYLQEELN